MRGDRFRHDRDVHAAEFLGGVDEPLHLLFLLGAGEHRQIADLLVEERSRVAHVRQRGAGQQAERHRHGGC